MTEHLPLQPLTAGQMDTLRQAMIRYEDAMTVEAARYLLDRGLTEETVRTARLGVVADPIPAHERYQGWLAIPYLLKDQPLRIRFRRPDWISTDGSKYGQPSGETLLTYGVDSIHEADDEIHVTEGEFDAMVLKQVGLHAIALPGASTFRGYHGRMLAGFNRVFVWGDPDPAGAEFTTTVVNRLPRSGRGVQLRVGDITETYLHGRESALFELVEKAR